MMGEISGCQLPGSEVVTGGGRCNLICIKGVGSGTGLFGTVFLGKS